jgi:hypothetical protein
VSRVSDALDAAKKRKPRQARNPRTGEKVWVREKFVVTFRVGNKVQNRLEALAAWSVVKSQETWKIVGVPLLPALPYRFPVSGVPGLLAKQPGTRSFHSPSHIQTCCGANAELRSEVESLLKAGEVQPNPEHKPCAASRRF